MIKDKLSGHFLLRLGIEMVVKYSRSQSDLELEYGKPYINCVFIKGDEPFDQSRPIR